MMREEHKIKIRKNQKNCKPVFQLNRFGIFVAEYFSIGEASRLTNIGKTAVSNALRQTSGVHYAGGYLWRYKKDYIISL